MKGPKVVVIGAGSLFFGRQSLWQMLDSEVLRHGTLAYVDIDRGRLKKMVALGKLMVDHLGSPLEIEGSVDRRKVLGGADFVVLSFAKDNARYRGIDCKVSKKYGVLMCSGDTIGPGGIFRAMRELPVVLEIAKDVRKLCPDAWLINYVNPTAVNGIGLLRHAPDLKTLPLCDGHHMPHLKRHWLVRAGIARDHESVTPQMEADLDLRIAGVNHFTWILSATHNGRDVMPAIRKIVEKSAAKERATARRGKITYSEKLFRASNYSRSKEHLNANYALALWDIYGAFPDTISHTKEYVPYWQGHNAAKGKLPPLFIFDAKERLKRHDAMWREIDGYLSGKTAPAVFVKKYGPDHATDIIESMWGKLGKQFYINQPNRAPLENMDDDAFFELLCDVDMNGLRPVPVGKFPKGIRGLEQQVLETHELTVEAIVKCDRTLLRRAMLLDPIVNSIPDADKIIAELFKAERSVLPKAWFR